MSGGRRTVGSSFDGDEPVRFYEMQPRRACRHRHRSLAALWRCIIRSPLPPEFRIVEVKR